MKKNDAILILGAGIAGMEAALMLAGAGKQVYLVERLPLIGGNTIKNEETYPNLECSTCMVAPIQQDVLQHPGIQTMTWSELKRLEGESGTFKATVLKKARYVNLEACIGCGMCFEPCPVSLDNEWEENLMQRKAIYVPCSGALPNVPVIDPEHCLKLSGKQECDACVQGCMFGAVELDQKDEEVTLDVDSVIVATGYRPLPLEELAGFGYGKYPGVYTAMEFERLFASNGPTSGELTLRDGSTPSRIAIIHCVGREERGYCSGVCCMHSFKHAHFIRHKLPDAKVFNLYRDICVPDKTYQRFFEKVKKEGDFRFIPDGVQPAVTGEDGKLQVQYASAAGETEIIEVDMVILAVALVPNKGASEVAQILDIKQDSHGFFQTIATGSVESSRKGIFIAGCCEGPKDIQGAVLQAESCAGQAMI